jgi:hypothetical protein
MNRVVEEADIDIEFGTDVKSLATDGTPCIVLMDGSTRCAKHRVFVGTGLREKDERYLRAIGGVRYSEMSKEMAVGKRVCIIGNGNAGFEVAQNVFKVADRVIVSGKHPTRVSAVTKYTGDVRVKFLTTLENFHGKLLDTVVHVDLPFQWARDLDNSLNRTQGEELTKVISAVSYVTIHQCEVLVLATGFQSVVPGKKLSRRFPSSGKLYAATDNPNIHYVGWLMHQRDFRRGAGGFLSGYRYLIRNLIHHVREEDHGIPYPHLNFTKQGALEHAVKRFQIAADLVIMQDGVVLRDAIVPTMMKGGHKKEYHYYEGVTYNFFEDFEQRDDIIYLYFAWGDGRSAASVFDNVYLYNDTEKLRNIYLHPLVEVNGLVREAEEDLDMAWNNAQFIPPIKRIVRDAIKEDYTKFYPKPAYPYKREEVNQPKDKPPYEKGNDPSLNIGDLLRLATEAILVGGKKEALRKLRAEARMIIPSLLFPPKTLPSSDKGGLGMEKCAMPGNTCDIDGCCGNGTSCVYVSDLDSNFCVAAQL